VAARGQEGSFGGDGYVHSLDCSDGYRRVNTQQNAHLNMHGLSYVNYTQHNQVLLAVTLGPPGATTHITYALPQWLLLPDLP